MEYYILLFYKFVNVEDAEKFKKDHLDFCNSLGIKGKVLIAKEGINGSISGSKEQIEKYKEKLRSYPEFSDVVFKEDIGKSHVFTKMIVRVKKEVIALGKEVNFDMSGEYIEPNEFLEMCENEKIGEDFIVLDTRNDYEWKVGKFKGAVTPKIKTFREFPEFVEGFKKNKDKKIVMYCTGGIRCEKASAYMKEQGFKDVKQLHGGIVTFCKELPDSAWEGRCFVFDKRLVTERNNSKDVISNCSLCDSDCDLYRNCKNKNCDKLVLMCIDCEKKMNACCSDKCLREFREFCNEKSRVRQGRGLRV